MKLSPDDLVEYLFRLILIASGIFTAILLISALARLLDEDAVGLGQRTALASRSVPAQRFVRERSAAYTDASGGLSQLLVPRALQSFSLLPYYLDPGGTLLGAESLFDRHLWSRVPRGRRLSLSSLGRKTEC
jgi:hypothetical protein